MDTINRHFLYLFDIVASIFSERKKKSNMSVETNSVPPWKLALLEKKRRQEEDRRKHDNEGQSVSQMPAWKREIILKKQHQKNSTVYLRKPLSPDRRSEEGEVGRLHSSGRNHSSANDNGVPNIHVDGTDGNGEEEVHILPITKNPLVKNDPNFKAAKQSRHSYLGASGSNSSHSNPPSHSSSWAGDTDGPNNRNSAIDDDVFSAATEEEVTYGRGFVHKLLQRFSHLSTKEEEASVPGIAARRSSSTENILEGRLGSGYTNGKATSPNRAHSTDNLLSPHLVLSPQNSYSGETVSSVNDTNSSHLSEDEADLHNTSIASNESVVEELPKPNTVRTARSVFEKNITTQPVSPVPVSPSEAALTKPKLPSKPIVAPQPEHGGKYYNDTLSRKAGANAVRLDESRTEDIADHAPRFPSVSRKEN